MTSIRRERRGLKIFVVLGLLLVCGSSGASGLPVRSVPLCSGITLSASYLAMTGPSQVPGFHFMLSNRTSREIKLAEPVPSSSHWYARARGRWWWRASNGAGGSLLNAGNEHGRVMVYPNQSPVGATCSPCPRTRAGNGRKARKRTLCSNTSRAVRSVLTLGKANTR